MIDLETENVFPLKETASHRLIRARSAKRKAANFCTVWRWATKGLGGVVLETVRVGGTLCTSDAAIRRFIERLSNPSLPANSPTPSETTRAHRRAQAELTAAGI